MILQKIYTKIITFKASTYYAGVLSAIEYRIRIFVTLFDLIAFSDCVARGNTDFTSEKMWKIFVIGGPIYEYEK